MQPRGAKIWQKSRNSANLGREHLFTFFSEKVCTIPVTSKVGLYYFSKYYYDFNYQFLYIFYDIALERFISIIFEKCVKSTILLWYGHTSKRAKERKKNTIAASNKKSER